ncbi:MAG: hypothetical protein ABIS69_07380, partial [Sediminibacterium sp.]
TLSGWQLLMTAGSNSNAAFATGTGSSTGNGVYSLGIAASTDRALGSLSSSTGIYAMGLVLTNQTGSVLNTFTVSFTAEQWRKGGSTNKNIWTFHYKTGPITHIDQTGLKDLANLNFSSIITTAAATSLNGNLSENRQPVLFTVSNITWKPGEQLLLRWDDADETGSDDAVAIDNFSFSATLLSGIPIIETSTVTNITENAAVLTVSANDNYATASLLFEIDSSNLFSSPVIMQPSPAILQAGSGNTISTAAVSGLASGITYYFRPKATNINGTITGSSQNFTTAISLPTITTNIASAVTTSTAILGGNAVATGGAAITEKGIVWALSGIPTLSNNKISMGRDIGNYSQTVAGLPPGTTIYARSYAINAGGIAYGDTVRFVTQTVITSLTATSTAKTNAATVTYSFKTVQTIVGLAASNFSLLPNGITGASITGITGSTNTFTITVNTGTGNGTLGLSFINDAGLSVPVNNKPFISSNEYIIDKIAPTVTNISIPDKNMKTGDTIPVTVFVKPDQDVYKMQSGNVDGFNLSAFTKKNDSVYTCWFVIVNGGNDIDALNDIPALISLLDSTGNISSYQSLIKQASDRIDANKPFIISIQNPPKGIYKAGDSLYFTCRFNETIVVSATGIPSITITVGTRSRTAMYVTGSGSDSLLFRFIIPIGDLDADGIKTSSTITLNSATIKDIVGNTASVSFSNTIATKDILIDGVVPVITSITVPVPLIYKTGNILDFVVNYSKRVFIISNSDFPFIAISIGTKIKNATYINGTGSTSLLFRYTIQVDDVDTDGLQLISSINDANGAIKDSVGNPATALLNNIGAMTGIQINPPTILLDHIIVPENDKYTTGDTLEFLISYNEPVFVSTQTGSPSLKITVGSTIKQAVYISGSSS